MQTLIYKKPNFQFPPHHIHSNSFLSETRKNHNEYLRIPQNEFRYNSKTVKLCSAAAPQSLSYGGWDDSQLGVDSVNSGESNQFYIFLSSIGIADKKYVFVYLFGFVCALAISRVKVSTIMLFPASAIIFALGFSVGLVKGGNLKEKRSNENRKKIVEDNLRGLIEILRNLGVNLKGCNAEVSNLKNGIRRSIECNQVTVSDLEGSIDVIESADISLGNTIELVESCIQSALGGDQENDGVSNHDSSKRRKKSVDNGLDYFQYFNGLFGWKFGGQVERSYTKRPSYTNQESSDESVFGPSRSSVLGNDLEFNSYLSEASNLLKEARGCLTKQADDDRAEGVLQKSEVLLSKALDVRPMSLLAVGQLGNTYLLHGELKLRRSRELRSLLARTDPLFDEEWGKVLKKFDDKVTNKNEITSALVNVCEECEELLIKAGRKYKLALSIDGNDMRALYNWGIALTFRAQLVADIGPTAARDADKIFLSAIDKFDAVMSKRNVYAPDALFRWGSALQHRSRLRPSRSREKVKLLQQARRLYEDALHMDSGNRPLQEALSSCISELDHWYG